MSEALRPTLYVDVNAVLDGFARKLDAILETHFLGMYLTGSLALGDFDPQTSDIDFIVLTDVGLSEERVEALRQMHAEFDTGGSPWAGKVEAVYITPEALDPDAGAEVSYPQVEKGTSLFVAPLESGWIFHLYTLREHGVAVSGPDVRPLIGRVDPDDMRRAAAPIAEMWLAQSRHDPGWVEWVKERKHRAFVVLTLCRLLYTLELGSVASKPAAGRWAEQTLEPRWSTLIGRALTEQNSSGEIAMSDMDDTIALVRYTIERFEQWKRSEPASN